MGHKLSLAALGMAASVLGAGAAAAYAPAELGRVAMVDGSDQSVLVVRGSNTYDLAVGDALMNGDQVFTRSNGTATLAFTGCTRDLAAASSLVVSDDVCLAQPIALQAPAGSGGAVGGGAVGGGAAAGGIGLGAAIAAGLAIVTVVAIASDDDGASS
jgi:hypothetical protein